MDTSKVKTLVEAEREAIVAALRACGGSKDGAAFALMIGRTTLYRRIEQFEIRPEEYMSPVQRAA